MLKRRLLFAVCMIALGATPLFAQDTTPEPAAATTEAAEIIETPISELSYDSPVVGNITDAQPFQDWPLLTASADNIRVIVERLDGNLTPGVTILDAAGNEISSSYGSDQTYSMATIDTFTLPVGGEFTVRVARERVEEGHTLGHYRLVVVLLATHEDNINNTTVISPVEYNTTISGEITGAHWIHRYSLTTSAPDRIRVTAVRTSDTFIPLVQILDSNGNDLASNYPYTTYDSASIDAYNLPSAQDYTIIVRRYDQNDQTKGSYKLTVELLGSGAGSPNLAAPAGTVVYGQDLVGELNNAQWYQDWTLEITSEDYIRVDVQRAADTNLRPELQLLGGAMQPLTYGYIDRQGHRSRIDSYQLTPAGTYTIRVIRDDEQNGLTTGGYTLRVTLLGAGVESESLAGLAGTVEIGTPVEGTITGERWLERWSFNAEPDQQVHIEAQRIEGTLLPIIQIRDTNDQVLTSSYVLDTNDLSILDYRFANASEYWIVVIRYSEIRGITTGRYRLSLEEIPQ